MSKLKELWLYAVFRWCVYQTPLLVFALFEREKKIPATILWILVLTLPALWVWRKAFWKFLKQVLSFLNKKAD